MRGTIDVTGGEGPDEPAAPPLYLRLGLDLDAPHPARPTPSLRPSAERGQLVASDLPPEWDADLDLRTLSPADVWLRLRQAPETAGRTDQALWDLTAYLWRSAASAEALAEGRALFADNCAACHGEDGSGEGVMAGSLPAAPTHAMGEGGGHVGPADFTDAERMLGASSALLQGKILRGGMGTGMPYFGPILTEDQTWALVDHLWSLSMDYEEVR
jgi:mono/diheme cytochrome c family protein